MGNEIGKGAAWFGLSAGGGGVGLSDGSNGGGGGGGGGVSSEGGGGVSGGGDGGGAENGRGGGRVCDRGGDGAGVGCMGVAMLTSVFLQRRKCGGCLRGEISLIFVFISKCLSFLANLLEETLTSLHSS